jgi:hypothetical protein
MTPKEKAKELVDKYLDLDNYNNLNLDLFCDECGMSTDAAKLCALIAVDEILDELLEIVMVTSSKYIIKHINYYQEVKQEIKKL